MGRGKHQRNKDSENRRAEAERALKTKHETGRERPTDHVESALVRPRLIIQEAVAGGQKDHVALENARQQVNSIRLAVEEDPEAYPYVSQERIDEMGKLIDQANEVLDRATTPETVIPEEKSEKKEEVEQNKNNSRLEVVEGEAGALSAWVQETVFDLRDMASIAGVLQPSREERLALIDGFAQGTVAERDFVAQLNSWRWGPLDRKGKNTQRELWDTANNLTRGTRELKARLQEIKALQGAESGSNEIAKENDDGVVFSEQVPAAEKTGLQEIEDEMEEVGDRLQNLYHHLMESDRLWRDEDTGDEEMAALLDKVAKGEPIDAIAAAGFKKKHAKEVTEMLTELRDQHARYLALEAERKALENPEAAVIAAPQVEVVETPTQTYTQKDLEQARKEFNKTIGKSFRARDQQRKLQRDTIVPEIDVNGELVATIGQRGLLGKRRKEKEMVKKENDNTLVRAVKRERGNEDAADPKAEERQQQREFTRAIVDFKNAVEELRGRIARFAAEPDEDGLQQAYDLMRETEQRVAAAFEKVPEDYSQYDIVKELAASAIKDQGRALDQLRVLREQQENASGDQREQEAELRAYLQAGIDGLTQAQLGFSREVKAIKRDVKDGIIWNDEGINFAIRDVQDAEEQLREAIEKTRNVNADFNDLIDQAIELDARSTELRQQRGELIRFIEEKEQEARDVTQQADEEDTQILDTPVTEATIVPDDDHTQTEEPVQQSWLRGKADVFRRAFSYVMSGWQEAKNLAQDSRELAAAQFTGALTSSERGARELGVASEAARLVTGLTANLALTATGTKLFADLPRYLSQKYFVAGERERLAEGLSEIVTMDKLDKRMGYAMDRSSKMREQIETSQYLTDEQKQDMLRRLHEVDDEYIGAEAEEDEAARQAIANIVEKAIKTRVSGTRVIKEALNTALIATGPAALFLRPGAYSVVSLIERYQNVSEANPDSGTGEKMKQALANGFSEWWQKLQGEVGDTRTKRELNRLAAVGTLARAFGVVGGSIGEMAMITNVLTAAGAPFLLGESDEVVPESIIKLADREPTASDAMVFVPEDVPRVAVGLEESPEAFLAAVSGGAPESGEMYEGGIPPGSEVRKFDGIVGTLARVIKANPEAYGFDGDTDIGQELFAKKLAMQMARKEGIMNNDWLSDKSIGQLFIVPERDGDSWKIAFVDREMHKLDFDDVREQGYIMKANKMTSL